jgi:Zn-dependent peptidase ImmA (M78 family)
MSMDATFLDRLFGPDSSGATTEERARSSKRLFVRAIDQLAEDSPEARGRRLTALEALKTYGQDVLFRVGEEGSALLSDGPDAAGRVLRARRELLQLDTRAVARRARVSEAVVQEAEHSVRVPIRELEKIARALGLDERYISFKSEPVGNQTVAYRLRTVGQDRPNMSPSAVSAIAEGAWAAGCQIRLEKELGLARKNIGIEPSENYGYPGYPPYLHGYFLAADARARLDLGQGSLPKSLREIAEEVLGLPVIRVELGEHIAGVTVEVDGQRAILLNAGGGNRTVYVQRSTVAHELAHILYDTSDRLNVLRVDDFDEVDDRPELLRDPVEQRANAFGAEFLAPRDAVLACFRQNQEDPVGAVMSEFGVSPTVAQYQIWNGLEHKVPLESLSTRKRAVEEHFVAGESYTADFHPLRIRRTSRSGRFSAVVVRAAQEGLISWDTAAEYLECPEHDVRASVPDMKDLFPAVFE